MRIILASPRGFCAGVNMAIDSLTMAIQEFGTPLYGYHEIVHNRWVVDQFLSEGVTFVNDLSQVTEGAHLLYSAHGVSPEIRRQAALRNFKTIDATCPLVTKVHKEAIRFASEGYIILLVGHANHDEVIGTMGEVPNSIILVQTTEDVDRLEPERLAGGLIDDPDARAADCAFAQSRGRDKEDHVAMLRGKAVMGGGGAEADVVRIGDAAGEREKIAVADGVRALVGGHEKVLPPGCAFEPTLASQGLDHVVGGLLGPAKDAQDFPARHFAAAVLAEGQDYPALLGR